MLLLDGDQGFQQGPGVLPFGDVVRPLLPALVGDGIVAAPGPRPVLPSHSNAAVLCSDFPRNLTDAQFEALVKRGGGAGLNLCPDFLGLTRDVEACCAHIEHFLALGGERAVFIGADLDGIDDTPRGIAGVQDVGSIYEALLRRNHPESLVRGIFYNNLMDILERST